MRPIAWLPVFLMALVIALAASSTVAKPKGKAKRADSSSESTASGSRSASAKGDDVHVHEGFFLRLASGLGYARAICSEDSGQYLHGLSLVTDLSIGGSVTRNLALHLSIFGHDVVYGKSQPDGGDLVMFGYGFGLGLTYHFQPINLYLSTAFGVGFHAAVGVGANNVAFTLSKAGFAMEFLLGKEWWVSENWGLGIATQLIFMNVADAEADVHWNDVGIGILMTATYN